jgi:hypothetical protein
MARARSRQWQKRANQTTKLAAAQSGISCPLPASSPPPVSTDGIIATMGGLYGLHVWTAFQAHHGSSGQPFGMPGGTSPPSQHHEFARTPRRTGESFTKVRFRKAIARTLMTGMGANQPSTTRVVYFRSPPQADLQHGYQASDFIH